MNKIYKIALSVLFFFSSLSAQTLLMKPGNAAEYNIEREFHIKLCTDTAHIKGNIYYVFKRFPVNDPEAVQYNYERIQGDSLHITLNNSEEEVILFNFNRQQGDTLSADTVSNHIIYAVLDTIEIVPYGNWIDTLYTVNDYVIDILSGDTISVDPNMNYSKKFGLISTPLLIMTGKKIDGVRIGLMNHFPDEVYLSNDSLYFYSQWDTVTFFMYNTSDAAIRIDSLQVKPFPHRGYSAGFGKDTIVFNIFLFSQFPESYPWEDTVFISPHDSVKAQFFISDLCPICKESDISDFFEDSIRITLSFTSGVVPGTYFTKSIVFRGDVPSSVEEENVIKKFELLTNYPNPFNSTTSIEFYVSEKSNVHLSLYDILGSKITDILSEERLPGNHKISFDAGKLNLASGVYFLKFNASKDYHNIFEKSTKIMYLK